MTADDAVDPAAPERLRADRQRVPVPQGSNWLPGPTWAWVISSAAVFVLAASLAFSTNDDDAAAVASQQQAEDTGSGAEQAGQAASQSQSSESTTNPQADARPETAVQAQSADDTAQTEAVTEAQPESELTGFIIPIDGACLSGFEGHFPSSPREYRNGTHEGFDFYGFASCRTIDNGTAVLAAKAGTIVRIDQTYTEITLAQFEEATDPSVVTLNPDVRAKYLDRLRGRQVWIDHGAGVVTRYAHLSAVAVDLQLGDVVRAGRVVGFVGESGQLEAITAPGTDWHLHFEIRVNEGYLGEGLTAPLARALYAESFGLASDAGP